MLISMIPMAILGGLAWWLARLGNPNTKWWKARNFFFRISFFIALGASANSQSDFAVRLLFSVSAWLIWSVLIGGIATTIYYFIKLRKLPY